MKQPYKLYGRLEMSSPFKLDSHHATYRDAVIKGQNRYGYGMFLVGHENPDHNFTRDEQLLKPINLKELLETL
jgi:hypothetical protein